MDAATLVMVVDVVVVNWVLNMKNLPSSCFLCLWWLEGYGRWLPVWDMAKQC